MDKVLSATGYLENIAADREGNYLLIPITKDLTHGNVPDTFFNHCFRRHNEPAVDKCPLITDRSDLITFRKIVPLVNETMLRSDQETVCIRICRDLPNQVHDLPDCFFAGDKYFIFRICLISTGIDLVVVHIDHLHTGEDTAQLILLQALDIIKLYADTICLMLLQNRLPSNKIIAKDIIRLIPEE